MTKKVISIIFLIVTSLIFATSVFADYVGATGKDFSIVFTNYVENYFSVTVKDLNNNKLSESSGLDVNTTSGLKDSQCKIVLTTNCAPTVKITFNVLKNVDKNSDTIAYYVCVYQADESTPFDDLSNLYVNGEKSGSFTAGEVTSTYTTEDFSYPLAFKFDQKDLDGVAPGEYEALIQVEVSNP